MPKDHTPVIRKPTDEELDFAIAHAESRGMYGLLGMLLDYKQMRMKERFKEEQCKTS